METEKNKNEIMTPKLGLSCNLPYGIQCLPISKKKLKDMDRAQARLIKTSLGLTKFCKNTHLLQSMKINTVSRLRDMYTMDLLCSHMKNDAKGRTFYSYILKQHRSVNFSSRNNLVNRCIAVCQSYSISLFKYMFLDEYAKSCKRLHFKSYPVDNGIVDSVTYLLSTFNYENRVLLQDLLIPF